MATRVTPAEGQAAQPTSSTTTTERFAPPPKEAHIKTPRAERARLVAVQLTSDSVPLDVASGSRRRPKMLDLFCGGGGAAFGYWLAGFDVVGCDIAPHNDYPFEFLQENALQVSMEGYEAVHASPPCLAYTLIIPASQRLQHGHKWGHESLIEPIRDRLVASGLPYIIENVMGAARELLNPVKLNGTMFDLRVFRQRLFESNVDLVTDRPSNFAGKCLGIHSSRGHGGQREGSSDEMLVEGIDASVPEAGWRVEQVERQSGASKGRFDKYYYHEATGKRFRSVFEVQRHLGVRVPRPQPAAADAEADALQQMPPPPPATRADVADPITSCENIWEAGNAEYFAVYGSPGAKVGKNRGTLRQWQQAMAGPLLQSLEWLDAKPLAQSIPPAYSEYLGRQMLRAMGFTVDYPPISYKTTEVEEQNQA